MSLRCSCTVSNKKCLSLPQMRLTACLNVACEGRSTKQRNPSSSEWLTSPPGMQRNGQSTAQKSKLAYPLAQIHALNCSCVSSCSPHLRSISLFFPPLTTITSLSKCVNFSSSFTFRSDSPSNHPVFIRRLLCKLRRRMQRKMGAGNSFGMFYYRNEVVSLKWCSHNQHIGTGLPHRMTITAQWYVHFFGLNFGLSIFLYLTLFVLPLTASLFIMMVFVSFSLCCVSWHSLLVLNSLCISLLTVFAFWLLFAIPTLTSFSLCLVLTFL